RGRVHGHRPGGREAVSSRGTSGQRQPRLDGRSAARCGIEVEIASCKLDALLHSEQALAAAAGGALASVGDVEPRAVVADAELQVTVDGPERDPHPAGTRVTDDVGEGLLDDPERRRRYGRAGRRRERLRIELEL